VHVEGLPETRVTCAGMCRPAATCPARCELPVLPASLPAAQPGTLATWRFDRFGNRITSPAGEAPFLATATGPGELKTKVIEEGSGLVKIRYMLLLILIQPDCIPVPSLESKCLWKCILNKDMVLGQCDPPVNGETSENCSPSADNCGIQSLTQHASKVSREA
jgi:hypothetical protein